jgi:hypothetical protein
MTPVTVEELKDAITKKYAKDGFIPFRKCSICNEWYGHYIRSDDVLWFDTSCGCGGGGGRYVDYSHIAELINSQSSTIAHNLLRKQYGLNVS